jgi:hypothetical protein
MEASNLLLNLLGCMEYHVRPQCSPAGMILSPQVIYRYTGPQISTRAFGYRIAINSFKSTFVVS